MKKRLLSLTCLVSDVLAAPGVYEQEMLSEPVGGGSYDGIWLFLIPAYLIGFAMQFWVNKKFFSGEQSLTDVAGLAIWWLPLGAIVTILLFF